jgi:hypothetical protein
MWLVGQQHPTQFEQELGAEHCSHEVSKQPQVGHDDIPKDN